MPPPIYPTQLKLFHELAPEEVHSDCVEDYNHSRAREQIWHGAKSIVRHSSQYHTAGGRLYFAGEFVHLINEPNQGILLFEYEDRATPELKNFWCKNTISEWMCDTRLMPAKPHYEGLEDVYEVHRIELMNDLTDYGNVGLPVTNFEEWHGFTK